MNEELKTLNTLKYLPIRVTREYFQSLPESILEQFYEYLVGKNVFNRNPDADAALLIYIYFLSFQRDGANYLVAKELLTSYILNYE